MNRRGPTDEPLRPRQGTTMTTFPLRLRAVFRDGKFVPTETCSLPESAEVQLTVEPPRIIAATVTDPVEWSRNMAELIERMKSQPLRPDAPKLTRDELHERR